LLRVTVVSLLCLRSLADKGWSRHRSWLLFQITGRVRRSGGGIGARAFYGNVRASFILMQFSVN
jgi:hypothetical protein